MEALREEVAQAQTALKIVAQPAYFQAPFFIFPARAFQICAFERFALRVQTKEYAEQMRHHMPEVEKLAALQKIELQRQTAGVLWNGRL